MRKFALLLTMILFVGMSALYAQTKKVTGTVTSSEDGATLPGVSVVVKGTTIGIITDIDGVYQLDVPNDAKTLVFSFVGMSTKEAEITGSKVDVVLEPNVIGVDEVMVVAYGTAKKETFTGSAASVNKEALENLQASSVVKALQGNAPGVQVISSSGQPGANPTIRIRGTGSINASSAPLYVVDGAPYDGNISSLNPDDIETMTVLKDAAAASLYGSRAANGVVIIKTKTGKSGKTKISFKLQHGVSSRAVDAYDYVRGDEIGRAHV